MLMYVLLVTLKIYILGCHYDHRMSHTG